MPESKTSGDVRAAVSQFFRDQYSSIVAMIMVVEGATRDEAEDAVMAAMPETLRNWPWIQRHRAWVRRATRSHFLRALEGRRRLDAATVRSASREADIDPALSQWEDQQWVAHLLDSLPPAQRQVLQKALDGLTTGEIAEMLGKNQPTVRKNLQFARDRLRARLDLITLELAAPGKEERHDARTRQH